MQTNDPRKSEPSTLTPKYKQPTPDSLAGSRSLQKIEKPCTVTYAALVRLLKNQIEISVAVARQEHRMYIFDTEWK